MKKKALIIISIILLIICIIVGFLLFTKQRDEKIILIQDNIIIEYGKTYNPSLEELIDLEEFSFIDIQKVNIDSTITNENNKEYPAVGIYEIKVNYKNRNLLQKVEIKDTISPELNVQESIEVLKDTDLSTYDFSRYISISDLSEIEEYNIDFSNVNVNQSGEYIAKISIQDIYSNKTQKEFKIIIPEVEEESVEENMQENQNLQYTPTVNTSSKTNNNVTSTVTTNNNKIQATENKDKESEVQVTTPEQSIQQDKIEKEPEEQEIVRCTNNNNHAIGVGNSGQWFNSKNEAIAFYDSKISYWGKQWEEFKIDDETYYNNCPSGYEIWSCMYCSKWSINFYYR